VQNRPSTFTSSQAAGDFDIRPGPDPDSGNRTHQDSLLPPLPRHGTRGCLPAQFSVERPHHGARRREREAAARGTCRPRGEGKAG
jgi:hypothetical protein